MITTNRTQIPLAQSPRVFNFPTLKRFQFDNGLQIIHVKHDKLPTLAIQMLIGSAANYDPQGKEGIASFVADMLPEGTQKRSSLEISTAFEDLGTQFDTHAGWNVTYIEMIVVKKRLKKSMELFCDVLFNPAFAEEEMERLRKKKLHERVRVADNAGNIANEKFNQVLFANTRYSLPAIGQSQQIKHFVKKDLQDFYDQVYNPQNATLIIAGDIDFEGAKKLAADHFATWRGKNIKKINEPQFQQAKSSIVYLVNKPGAKQAEIRVGHLGIDRHNPDYFAATLANQILGGYFLSRLNLNLREEKGFTYGVHSRFISRKALGSFQISSAIDTRNVFEAINEIIKEIRLIRDTKITEVELQQAQGYLTGIFPIAFESCPQIAAGISTIVEYDLEDHYYRRYREKIMEISSNDVQSAARKYFHPDKMIIVVCADISTIIEKFQSVFDVEISEYRAENE